MDKEFLTFLFFLATFLIITVPIAVIIFLVVRHSKRKSASVKNEESKIEKLLKYRLTEFKKNPSPYVTGKIIILALAILIISISTLLSLIPDSDLSFNRTKWIENPAKRYKLTKNLIESELLIGLTKEAVREKLGESLFTGYDSIWQYDIGWVDNYPSTLKVSFKENRVIEVSQDNE